MTDELLNADKQTIVHLLQNVNRRRLYHAPMPVCCLVFIAVGLLGALSKGHRSYPLYMYVVVVAVSSVWFARVRQCLRITRAAWAGDTIQLAVFARRFRRLHQTRSEAAVVALADAVRDQTDHLLLRGNRQFASSRPPNTDVFCSQSPGSNGHLRTILAMSTALRRRRPGPPHDLPFGGRGTGASGAEGNEHR